MMTSETLSKTCPNCGAKMPINFGYITWCDGCNYNLDDTVETGKAAPHGLFPRLWAWLGMRSGERIFQSALAAPDLRPRLGFAIVLAYGVALLVHGLTLLIVAVAITWLVWALRDFGQVYLVLTLGRGLGALVLLLLAWKIRPHVGRVPPDAVRRAQAPGLEPLFALCDRVADALHAAHIQAIWITPEFGASMGQRGWSGDYVLSLGLPLLVTLERQELVGLVGHELAHIVSQDPQRTWLIHSAMHSLVEWTSLFSVNRFGTITTRAGGAGLGSFIVLLYRGVMILLSFFAWLAGGLIALLIYPDMQRAEYRADSLAARVAGTDTLLRLMRKQYLRQAIKNIYLKAQFMPGTRIVQEIQARTEQVPEREWLRIQRVIDKGVSRLDDSHPTTKDRMALLYRRPKEAGQVSLSAAEFERIRVGLKAFEYGVESRIREELQKSL